MRAKKKIVVNVSGGETSAYMAIMIIKALELKRVLVFGDSGKPKRIYWGNDKYEVVFVFMNTGREHEKTLEFLNNLDRAYNLDLIWLEAVVNPRKNKGIGFNIVSFKTADRSGWIFEQHIAKYGIPSKDSPHCTRDLKAGCCMAYLRSRGWQRATLAIGYRFDEPQRVNLLKAKEKLQWYPLFENKITKVTVKFFWSKQSFKLGLKEFEGNCRLCFKKSKRKILTQILTDPDAVNWVIDMELKYPNNPNTGEKVFFYRDYESIFDLIAASKEDGFTLWQEPIGIQHNLFDYDLDEQEDCSESCEPFFI